VVLTPARVKEVHNPSDPESPLDLLVSPEDWVAYEVEYSATPAVGTWSWPTEDTPPAT
jgi:hypothetical protein